MSTSLGEQENTAPPNRDTALRAVNGDLFPDGPTDGLRPAFTPLDAAGNETDDPAVVLRDEFDERHLGDMLGPRLSAVPWQVDVRHTGSFRGIPATGRPVRIVGVSILDLSADDNVGVIHRFVNWEEVMGQIGVVYAARSIT